MEKALVCTYVIEDNSFDEPSQLAFLASVGARWVSTVPMDEKLKRWLAEGHRKHLRRAKSKDFERLSEVGGTFWNVGELRCWTSELHEAGEQDKLVKRLQLSGFRSGEEELKLPRTPATVIVNSELGMSFGKSGIAAAHAAQALSSKLLSSAPEIHRSWEAARAPVRVIQEPIDKAQVETLPYASVIEDHGLTEVEPGSITAVAYWGSPKGIRNE